MLARLIEKADFVLGEGSLYERLRRSPAVRLDPEVAHAGLIYDERAREVLAGVHREYLDIGQRFGLPMVASSPTWRANKERMARSELAGLPVNRDAVRFMAELRAGYGAEAAPILIAGQSGPKGDGYLPGEAPASEEAEAFHRGQLEALAEGGADFLIAQTLPAFAEALGIARAAADIGLPYVISFVVRPAGTLLDGTPLDEAVARIDGQTERPPAAYNVNCVHASVFAAAMAAVGARSPEAAGRIVGLHANTSAKTPEELDGLEALETEAPEDFGKNLWCLRRELGIRFLGGCCGTATAHMEALARRWQAAAASAEGAATGD